MAHNSHSAEDNSKTTPKMLQHNIHPTASSEAHKPTISTPTGAWNAAEKQTSLSFFPLDIYLIKMGLLHPQANSRWAATSAVCADYSV